MMFPTLYRNAVLKSAASQLRSTRFFSSINRKPASRIFKSDYFTAKTQTLFTSQFNSVRASPFEVYSLFPKDSYHNFLS